MQEQYVFQCRIGILIEFQKKMEGKKEKTNKQSVSAVTQTAKHYC
jgi:uncharacterized protein YkvS